MRGVLFPRFTSAAKLRAYTWQTSSARCFPAPPCSVTRPSAAPSNYSACTGLLKRPNRWILPCARSPFPPSLLDVRQMMNHIMNHSLSECLDIYNKTVFWLPTGLEDPFTSDALAALLKHLSTGALFSLHRQQSWDYN